MSGWCQRNVTDWVRICGPDWTVRILDNVPDSPNYALNYLPRALLPEAFIERKMDGPYAGPHSADFLRGACLYEHGGVYMDVGSILFRDMDRICWNEIEDPNNPVQVAVPLMYKQTIANHFVASRKGDPFIKRWCVESKLQFKLFHQHHALGTTSSPISGRATPTTKAFSRARW
jgi:hypothetical protein